MQQSIGQQIDFEAAGLGREDLLEMYRLMVLARSLSNRMWMLTQQGKAAFAISCRGHEVAQVSSAWALKKGPYVAFPYYRDLGVVLTLGVTPRDIMLGFFAKAEDPSSAGRQMPTHYGDPRLNIISGSSPVATQVPQAAGVALAEKIRHGDKVAIAYFGDGGSSKGDFHEGLNFAGIHKLPVIFFCENNGFAISVPQRKQMAIENVADRAACYGMAGETMDGTNAAEVYRATREALERARRGEGPTLLEAKVYRLAAHSTSDDQRRYLTPEQIGELQARDPVDIFEKQLEEAGILTREMIEETARRVAQEVDEATDYAERAPYPKPEDALTNVYGS